MPAVDGTVRKEDTKRQPLWSRGDISSIGALPDWTMPACASPRTQKRWLTRCRRPTGNASRDNRWVLPPRPGRPSRNSFSRELDARSVRFPARQEHYVNGDPGIDPWLPHDHHLERRLPTVSFKKRRTAEVNIGQTPCYSAASLVELGVGGGNDRAVPEPARRQRNSSAVVQGNIVAVSSDHNSSHRRMQDGEVERERRCNSSTERIVCGMSRVCQRRRAISTASSRSVASAISRPTMACAWSASRIR